MAAEVGTLSERRRGASAAACSSAPVGQCLSETGGGRTPSGVVVRDPGAASRVRACGGGDAAVRAEAPLTSVRLDTAWNSYGGTGEAAAVHPMSTKGCGPLEVVRNVEQVPIQVRIVRVAPRGRAHLDRASQVSLMRRQQDLSGLRDALKGDADLNRAW